MNLLQIDYEKLLSSYALVNDSLTRLPPLVESMLNDSIAMEPYDALASRFERLVEIALNRFFRSAELHQFGKKSESLRDRLLCMQKIGRVTSVELWMEMRDFRNRIANDSLPEQLSTASGQFLTTIRNINRDVQLVIDKPESTSTDVVMTFHGTVETADKIVAAATKTLEETKKLASKKNILYISVAYPEENPDAYTERSLRTHLRGFKSRILFTQGMSDAKIQLRSWPILREKAAACSGCASAQSEELDGSKALQTKNKNHAKGNASFVVEQFFTGTHLT